MLETNSLFQYAKNYIFHFIFEFCIIISNRLKLGIDRIKNIEISTITTNVFFISKRIVGKDTTKRNSTNKAIITKRHRNYINNGKKLYQLTFTTINGLRFRLFIYTIRHCNQHRKFIELNSISIKQTLQFTDHCGLVLQCTKPVHYFSWYARRCTNVATTPHTCLRTPRLSLQRQWSLHRCIFKNLNRRIFVFNYI